MTKREKRRFPRFPTGILLDVHSEGASIGRMRGMIVDMSVGGMSFEADAALEEGSSLYLKINMPLEIRGEVRHIRAAENRHRYGVRFHKIGFFSPLEGRGKNYIAATFQKGLRKKRKR